MFDVIIIGAGVIGCSIARTLSKYNLNTLVLEMNSDVGDETSSANSAIVHSGYDPHPHTLKAKFNVLGNRLFPTLCKELDVEFEKIGSLTIASTIEEVEILNELKENGDANGVETRIIDRDELFKMEPFATKKAMKALYAADAGIVNPFELCVALMENAMDNGVKLSLNEEVVDIKKNNDYFKIKTNKTNYEAKVVVNAAGINSDFINNLVSSKKEKVLPRKGEYYVLDHFLEDYVSHTLFAVPSSKGKGILVTKTTHGNYLIGPSSEFSLDKDDKDTDKETLNNVIKEAYRLVDYIPLDKVIREFSGVRCFHESNDFVINQPVDGFINFLGIQSPGLASSPAIARECEQMISKLIPLEINKNYNPYRRKVIRMNKLSIEERNEIIKKDSRYGRIICRCEKISLGEVIDCIERNCGATTIKGVKKRCRPGFGKCQGGFCEPLVLEILSKELGKNPLEIRYANKDSYILKEETKVIK